ncbi:MAG: DUF167 domain-containing protein [Planctomycetota bacterium]
MAAAPEKGKANQALIDFLAKKLKIKKTNIKITSGHTSFVKSVHISDMSSENLLIALNIDSRGCQL